MSPRLLYIIYDITLLPFSVSSGAYVTVFILIFPSCALNKFIMII